LSLTLIDKQYAEPGIEMSVVWGEHPGQACPPTPISASRVSTPFDDHPRNMYRRNP
jgi:vanillate/3-O-methylgallate O-demethylase